tara:strand:+ start:436 stop:681 length:246 start_codon:yes stop_codon:yes gene_type:complete
MILYQKKTDENNILGYEYIYEDENNYVFITYKYSRIKSINIRHKSILEETDYDEIQFPLDEYYEILSYGELKFHIGQLNVL